MTTSNNPEQSPGVTQQLDPLPNEDLPGAQRTERLPPLASDESDPPTPRDSRDEGSRATRYLRPAAPQRARQRRRPTPATREQVALYIEALGDTTHPSYGRAVEALTEIGAPAVQPLCDVLRRERTPWLAAYRATEALGAIGDSRATDTLLATLDHPHSNVRWGAIQALVRIGDLRSVLALRRVAANDNGRTSWGESVAEAARAAQQMLVERSSIWSQGSELLKTALVATLMVLSLVLAFNVVAQLQSEWALIAADNPGVAPQRLPAGFVATATAAAQPQLPIPLTDEEAAAATPEATPPAAEAPPPPPPATGTVVSETTVWAAPAFDSAPVGIVVPADQLIFIGRNETSDWYLVRLAPEAAGGSYIDATTADFAGAGWVNRETLGEPVPDVPVFDPAAELPTPDAIPAPVPVP